MASINSMNSMFETAEQRAEREKYEAERKAFFESIPKRAEQTLIVGQSSESLVEELRKQLSELGVLRALDLQRIAALEAELAQARAECERLTRDRNEWAAKWRETRKQLAELKFPGMTGIVKALDAARKEGK